MVDLRERLQELADAATRDGVTPGAAAAIRRGRQRRRRVAGGVASLLVVALVAGAVASGRLTGPPARPAIAPATTTPLPVVGYDVRRDLPGGRTTEDMAFEDLSAELRRCPARAGKAQLIGYVRSREWRRVWMVAARPPAPGAADLCWTSGLFSGGGAGSFGGASVPSPAAVPLTAAGSFSTRFGTIEGQVTKRAVRVQVRFRDGRPPLQLAVIPAGRRYPVNFYLGFFPMTSRGSQPEWPPAEVAAFDAEGRKVAGCTIGPPFDVKPQCASP